MRLPWRRLTSVLALAAVIASVPTRRAASAETTAEELVQALQRRYDSIKDFSADFVHRYQGGVLRKQISERGHVIIKKPGKMRWDYTAPEKKLFVSDGVRIYSYIPEDKQAMVSPHPPATQTP